MEFLMSLLFILCFGSNYSFKQTTATASELIAISNAEIPGVTIVMSDDILYVNIDDTSDLLDKIELFDNSNFSVLRVDNCNSSQWTIDLSALSSGDYDVEVLTTLANTYNAVITIN